jgi:hypothetical protein
VITVEIAGGRFTVTRGTADDADATVETDPKTLAQILYEGRDASDATVTGDDTALERFRSAFSLPEPATV